MTQNWAIGEVREWFNRTVSKTVVPPGTVGSNPTLSVGYEYIVKSRECVNVWFFSLFTLNCFLERCESGLIGTPGKRVSTMWTVGSNPTLSVKESFES